MLSATLRLYLTANALIYCFFAVACFPEGLSAGLIAMLFSFAISSPALLILLFCFFLIHTCRPGLVVSWLLLLFNIANCIVTPLYIFGLNEWTTDDQIFFLTSLGSGLGATALQSFYLHNHFKSLHNENN